MAEKCDDCYLVSSDGIPCYLMFRENTDIQLCTRYVGDKKKHDKIVADMKKGKDKKEDKTEISSVGGDE